MTALNAHDDSIVPAEDGKPNRRSTECILPTNYEIDPDRNDYTINDAPTEDEDAPRPFFHHVIVAVIAFCITLPMFLTIIDALFV